MKNAFLLIVFLSSTSICVAQKSLTPAPPYQRFPTIPPFKLLTIDSSTYFTKTDLKKHKPLLLILFDPDCEHCRFETQEILDNIDEFKKIQIVMATILPFNMMKAFYEKYELQKFKNITVGQDFQYILPGFYLNRNLPYLALYDKKGKLLTTFEGTMKIENLLDIFK